MVIRLPFPFFGAVAGLWFAPDYLTRERQEFKEEGYSFNPRTAREKGLAAYGQTVGVYPFCPLPWTRQTSPPPQRRNPRAPGNALPSTTVARRDRRSAGRNGGGTGPGQRGPQRGPRRGGRAHPCRRGAGGPPASQLQPPKRGRARAGQGLAAPPGAAETPPTTTQPPRGDRPNRTAGGPQCPQARPPGLP